MSQLGGKQGRSLGGGEVARGGARAAEPGKSTLVDAHAAAEAGTAGLGGPLPHLDQIQRSFGRFDVSGVQAHRDGAAARANAEMGSQAYAHGDRVAFGAAPDLHTAAHEAAHVVQQRSGVQLKGGVGQAGDAYERHADAVADAVVAGRSAEGLLATMAPGAATNAGGGARAVQHQSMPRAQGGGAALASTGAEEIAQAGAGAGVARVRAAIAANNISQLIDVQRELRQQMAADPLHPPQDAREGLADARHWAMDKISEIRLRFQSQLDAARTGRNAGATASNTEAVDRVQKDMDTACTPYLDALMAGDPQYRYEHFDHDVQARVFAAVRLHAGQRGLAQVGQPGADQEAEADRVAHLPAGEEWCGAFAFTQAAMAGGMDTQWAGQMQGEGGIRSALHYSGTQNLWIWVFDHWEGLREYHTNRGSLRYYEELTSGPPQHGIEPGDIVLIDNAFGTDPDHITTAVSFDGRWLRTVGGNETGGVRESGAIDLNANPRPNDVTDHSYTGPGRRALAHSHKNWRVHGVGRWSVVDFERHVYTRSAQRPTAPPRQAELRSRS